MNPSRLSSGLLALAVVLATRVAPGDERVDFARDVQPIFQQHCVGCHGGVHRAGGLSLVAAADANMAGDSGLAFVVPNKPDESELLRRVTSGDADERMPAESPPLSPDEIAKLRRWIEQGGEWPKHWSLAPIRQINQPAVNDTAWPRGPIDALVLHQLEAAGSAPSPSADRYTLIRRLSLDLLGLSPEPAEADAFVADRAPDAYERLVDRLLANPHFGERWGRHWLDLARYADSDGYEVDKPRPDAYRWRDWVIDSINRDQPLDEFTIEQFAGDLLPEPSGSQHLATAYHRQTLTNNEGGVDKEEYRFKAVLDRVANTGTVWLGLTLGCAQCHDHPYDPVTQREVYALAAIFNNADETEIELPGERHAGGRKFRVLSERESQRTTHILKRGEFLEPGDEVQTGVLAALHALPDRSPDQPLNRLDLARWLVDPANPLTPRVTANQLWLRLFGEGLVPTPDDFGARGQPPTHPELLDWLAGELIMQRWSRKALIRQIVSSATYRQTSARLASPTSQDQGHLTLDFGPSTLDLPFPQPPVPSPFRQRRIRVEAEIVRDLHLGAGGLLSRRIGGPSVFPPLGEEFVKITFRSELPWKTSVGGDRYRRGMYTFFKRTVPYPDLMTFDCPDASVAAVARPRSNTPLQALTTLNSETCLEAARGLAQRVLDAEPADDRATVETMFRICLVRPPSAFEANRLADLLRTHRAWYESQPDDAAALVDDDGPATAALVATANVILNLDEFITRE